mgnify:CR=1 FL=1
METLNRDHNRIVWFDLPVANLGRAVTFYQNVLAIPVSIETFGEHRFAVLDHKHGNGGCLVVQPDNVGTSGPLMYFNTHGRIHDALKQVEAHGGKVLEPIHPIGPHGFRALVIDSEGNRIALHSETDE